MALLLLVLKMLLVFLHFFFIVCFPFLFFFHVFSSFSTAFVLLVSILKSVFSFVSLIFAARETEHAWRNRERSKPNPIFFFIQHVTGFATNLVLDKTDRSPAWLSHGPHKPVSTWTFSVHLHLHHVPSHRLLFLFLFGRFTACARSARYSHLSLSGLFLRRCFISEENRRTVGVPCEAKSETSYFSCYTRIFSDSLFNSQGLYSWCTQYIIRNNAFWNIKTV